MKGKEGEDNFFSFTPLVNFQHDFFPTVSTCNRTHTHTHTHMHCTCKYNNYVHNNIYTCVLAVLAFITL